MSGAKRHGVNAFVLAAILAASSGCSILLTGGDEEAPPEPGLSDAGDLIADASPADGNAGEVYRFTLVLDFDADSSATGTETISLSALDSEQLCIVGSPPSCFRDLPGNTQVTGTASPGGRVVSFDRTGACPGTIDNVSYDLVLVDDCTLTVIFGE